MLHKNFFRFFTLSFVFTICASTFVFATSNASGGGGGNNYSSASGGGGGNSYSSGYNDNDYGPTDEEFEVNGWTVVSRNNKYVLLRDDFDDYTVYKTSGGYYGHQYLNWYIENVWDSSEEFDYDKFLNYVDKHHGNLNRAFGSLSYFNGSAEDLESGNFNDAYDEDDVDADDYDEDDYDEDDDYSYKKKKDKHNYPKQAFSGGPGVVNNNIYNTGSLNDANVFETYGKVLASNNSQWIKNQDGTYSLFYVENADGQPSIAMNGFYTIVDNTNAFSINTYYFDNKGIMVTTPFVDSNGKTINFTSTGEVIR